MTAFWDRIVRNDWSNARAKRSMDWAVGINPRFEPVVHALGRWLPVETRAGIEATDKASRLRKAPTH